MDKLELKHLTPYFPYKLKTVGFTKIYPDPIITGVLSSNNHVYWNYHGATGAWNLKDIKPILRPLSDLKKEIDMQGEKVSAYEILPGREREDYENPILGYWSWNAMQILFENHFDVFGLIEKGLAIDINTLKKQDNALNR